MAKQKEMTYSYYVSVQGSPPQDMSKMTEEERQEIFDKLARQFIENGLHGEVVTA